MGRLRGDLGERTLKFSGQIVNSVDTLPDRTKGWVLGKQLLRSGTSIGSNAREADHAFTDVEFAHKCGIARKEASETWYWLELCRRVRLFDGPTVASLLQEADELTRILSTLVKETQPYIERSKGDYPAGSRQGRP
jgi:four helix bundle protein